jgi:tetratricopeptide (TPR) repeat protein
MEGAVLTNRAEGLIARKLWAEASDSLDRALEICTREGDQLRLAEALRFQGVLERERGHFETAARLLAESLAVARRAEDRLLVAEVLRETAVLAHREGKDAEARTDLLEALDAFGKLGALLDVEKTKALLEQMEEERKS